jgi:hypothetical protein
MAPYLASVSLLGSAGSVETTDPSIVMNRKAELVAELRQLKADDNATYVPGP